MGCYHGNTSINHTSQRWPDPRFLPESRAAKMKPFQFTCWHTPSFLFLLSCCYFTSTQTHKHRELAQTPVCTNTHVCLLSQSSVNTFACMWLYSRKHGFAIFCKWHCQHIAHHSGILFYLFYSQIKRMTEKLENNLYDIFKLLHFQAEVSFSKLRCFIVSGQTDAQLYDKTVPGIKTQLHVIFQKFRGVFREMISPFWCLRSTGLEKKRPDEGKLGKMVLSLLKLAHYLHICLISIGTALIWGLWGSVLLALDVKQWALELQRNNKLNPGVYWNFPKSWCF